MILRICFKQRQILQACLMIKTAPTSAGWLFTCNRSGTMQLMLTWAASPSLLRVGGGSGGGAASARLGSHTGGRRRSTVAHVASTAPTILAEPFAPAMTWPTTTQRWQWSGTGRPLGKGHQGLWQQAAIFKRPGGVASVGTGGAPLY